MRRCADLPRRGKSASQHTGGRHGDRIRMTATAVAVQCPSLAPAADRFGKPGRPNSSRSDHRPVLAPWQVSIAKGFMLRQLAKPPHVSELARMCRLSPAYFVRAFANTVGVAPYAWLLKRRIAQAEYLLTNSRLPLAQIALECGFSDQAHFTNAFSKATGATPARWRKAQLKPSSDRRQTS
ncbi:AraC family transcriptional regulator [Sphingomonas panacis]|uniref:helix-turn-helix domain-containing protein n=1 Tax=Sphingomonas panacis TaxID=1560345 RepID=UPI0030B7F5DA